MFIVQIVLGMAKVLHILLEADAIYFKLHSESCW